MARRNRQTNGPVVVTGPGQDGKRVPSLGCGIAYAMHAAAQNGVHQTWYVRGEGHVAQIELHPGGVVTCETKAVL